MKKKFVILLLLSALSVNIISCGNSETDNNSKQTKVSKEDSAKNEDDSLEDLEAMGDVDVEKELFDVTLTILSEY